MENINICAVCNSENITHFMNCVDYTVSNKSFQIYECKDCSFKFTNPRPGISEISKYYESENYISHSNTKKGIFNKLYQYIRNITISQKLTLINKHVSRGTLLDIGCGTGEFLNFCKNKGWTTSGIEPGNDARKYASEVYGLTIHDENFISSIPDNSFDVITLWHVLEHVHDLNNREMK